MSARLPGILAAGLCIGLAVPASAQTAARPSTAARPQTAQAQPGAPLPPALQAAIQSGNAQAVSQAIATLSAGNPTTSAQLADRVIAAAEQLLAVNPQAALAVAGAAVEAVRTNPVQTAAPGQAQSVLSTAARIFVSPAVQQLDPIAAAALATSTLSAATTMNNPALMANVATQAVSVAERALALSPAVAVQLASAAVEGVRSQPVTESQPSAALDVVTTAARIVISPGAQQVDPTAVGQLSVALTQVATTPAVYQVSPTAAINVMSNAYAAATSSGVSASDPGAAAAVRQNLTQASVASGLNQANPSNTAQVNAILNRTVTVQPSRDQSVPPVITNNTRIFTSSPS